MNNYEKLLIKLQEEFKNCNFKLIKSEYSYDYYYDNEDLFNPSYIIRFNELAEETLTKDEHYKISMLYNYFNV